MVWTDPLRDMQDEPPAGYCARCGGELWPGELVYNWDDRGVFICPDCFKTAVNKLLELDPKLVALEMGVDYQEVGT